MFPVGGGCIDVLSCVNWRLFASRLPCPWRAWTSGLKRLFFAVTLRLEKAFTTQKKGKTGNNQNSASRGVCSYLTATMEEDPRYNFCGCWCFVGCCWMLHARAFPPNLEDYFKSPLQPGLFLVVLTTTDRCQKLGSFEEKSSVCRACILGETSSCCQSKG